jgi:hypothetical protein
MNCRGDASVAHDAAEPVLGQSIFGPHSPDAAIAAGIRGVARSQGSGFTDHLPKQIGACES